MELSARGPRVRLVLDLGQQLVHRRHVQIGDPLGPLGEQELQELLGGALLDLLAPGQQVEHDAVLGHVAEVGAEGGVQRLADEALLGMTYHSFRYCWKRLG